MEYYLILSNLVITLASLLKNHDARDACRKASIEVQQFMIDLNRLED